MSDKTKIEWTDATWNPITGCSIVSPGCANCYAMRLAGTRLRDHPSRAGLTADSKAGPVWNGKVRFNEEWLFQPLKWKRPRRIFVCAHGDLFHENVPFEWIDQVFAVANLARHHTFQILTKRAQRMQTYLAEGAARSRIIYEAFDISTATRPHCSMVTGDWPLPNVWLGVSVEDQKQAAERIPLLLDTPAAVMFISAEPLLGPIDLRRWIFHEDCDELHSEIDADECSAFNSGSWLDWVIAGGESGKDARPIHRDWARSLRDQCAKAGVPFFFKQWGEWAGFREYVGKKRAGRILDGREWNEFPARGRGG